LVAEVLGGHPAAVAVDDDVNDEGVVFLGDLLDEVRRVA
jgi:hypothetical protein